MGRHISVHLIKFSALYASFCTRIVMVIRKLFFLFFFFFVHIVGATSDASDCGGWMRQPSLHFPHISSDGSLYFSDKLIEIPIGSDLSLPIIVNFDNTRFNQSPYVGDGWRVALFESFVYSVDERRKHVVMPDGHRFVFLKKRDNFFVGNQGWVGKRDGDRFEIAAKCGSNGLVFERGYLSEISSGDDLAVLVRDDDGRVTSIVDGDGREVAFCRFDEGRLAELVSGKASLRMYQDVIVPDIVDRERVLEYSNSPSLLRIDVVHDGVVVSERTYERHYGRELDGLRVSRARGSLFDFSWDPKTSIVLNDGTWRYQVIEVDGSDGVERRKDGDVEVYVNNRDKGFEITKRAGQRYQRKQFYTRGMLKNKTRSIEYLDEGSELEDANWAPGITRSYDEDGILIREIDHEAKTELLRLDHGDGGYVMRLQTTAGDPLSEVTYGVGGKLISTKDYRKQLEEVFVYDSDGRIQRKEIRSLSK